MNDFSQVMVEGSKGYYIAVCWPLEGTDPITLLHQVIAGVLEEYNRSTEHVAHLERSP
jgi:hypothetical protein